MFSFSVFLLLLVFSNCPYCKYTISISRNSTYLNVHLLLCLLIHFLLNAHATLHVLVKKEIAQVLHFSITLTFKYYEHGEQTNSVTILICTDVSLSKSTNSRKDPPPPQTYWGSTHPYAVKPTY